MYLFFDFQHKILHAIWFLFQYLNILEPLAKIKNILYKKNFKNWQNIL